MSQFSFQSQPPESDPFRPARHAALLMGIIGLLVILLGAGVMFLGPSLPASTWPPELQQQFTLIQNQAHTDYATVTRMLGFIIAMPGLVLLTVAYFVRRGGSIAVRIGMVVTLLALLNAGSGILQSLRGVSGGDLPGIVSLAFSIIVAGLFVLQFVWLLQARRNQRMGLSATPAMPSAPIPPPPEFGDVFPPPPPPPNS